MKLLAFFICVLIFGTNVQGEEYLAGDCPDGKVDGDVWTTHDSGNCMGCRCEENEEVCKGCEDIFFDHPLKPDCLIVPQSNYNSNADFPDCCRKDVVVCSGDAGFVVIDLQEFDNDNLVPINE